MSVHAVPEITVTPDVAEVAAAALVDAIRRRLERSPVCRVGLSGGSTPGPILRRLPTALSADEHARLVVTWVDERHPEASNQRLAHEEWLAHAPAAPRVVPMVRGGSLQVDTLAFAAEFDQRMGGRIDVALLGLGPDGHVASLFPDHAALAAVGPVAFVSDSPKPPPTRITVTFEVLDACEAVIVVARGGGKADALRRALAGDLPLGMLAPAGRYEWIVDPDAGAALPHAGHAEAR